VLQVGDGRQRVSEYVIGTLNIRIFFSLICSDIPLKMNSLKVTGSAALGE
jgi:hypothetical protein